MSGSYHRYGMQESLDSVSDSELYGESTAEATSDSNTGPNIPNTSGLLSDNLLAKLMGGRSSNSPIGKNPLQPSAALSHYPSADTINPLKLLDYQYQQTLRSQLEPKRTSSEGSSGIAAEVKYVAQQSRSNESRRLESEKKGIRLEEQLKKFVARKKSQLFKPDQVERSSEYLKRFRMFIPDDYMAPLDSMMDFTSFRYQKHRFFDEIDIGDIYCCVVSSINESSVSMTLLCHATGKIREIEHLKINAFCSSRDIPELTSGRYRDVSDIYSVKDKIRAVVIAITQSTEKIQMSLLQRDLPRHMENNIQLGGIRFEDLPSSYKTLYENDNMTYRHMLHSNPLFNSPGAVSRLCAQLSIPNNTSFEVAEEEMAVALRSQQSRTQALHNVVKGVKLYKQGNETEALSLYCKALEIDSENVEGLVARGALYANNDSYPRALEDFAKALKLNPSHHNATSYLLQTLLAYAKDLEDQQDIEGALRCYKQMAALDPSDIAAKEMVITLGEKVRSKHSQEPTVSSTRPDSAGEARSSQRSATEKRKSLDQRSATPPIDRRSNSPRRRPARRVSRSPVSPAERRNLHRNISRSPVQQETKTGNKSRAQQESGKKPGPSGAEAAMDAISKHSEPQSKESKQKTESLDMFDIKEDNKSKLEKPKPPSMFLPYCLATDPVRKKVPAIDKSNNKGLENITVQASAQGRAVLRSSIGQDAGKNSELSSLSRKRNYDRSPSTSSPSLHSKSRSRSADSSRSRSRSRSRLRNRSRSRTRSKSWRRSRSKSRSRHRSSRHHRHRSSRSRKHRRHSHGRRHRSHRRRRRSKSSSRHRRSRHRRHSRDRRASNRVVSRSVLDGGVEVGNKSERSDTPTSSSANSTPSKAKSKNKAKHEEAPRSVASKNINENSSSRPKNKGSEKVDDNTESTSCVLVTKKSTPVEKPVHGQFKPMKISQLSLKMASDQLQKAKQEEQARNAKKQDVKAMSEDNDKKLKEMEDFLVMLKKKKDSK